MCRSCKRAVERSQSYAFDHERPFCGRCVGNGKALIKADKEWGIRVAVLRRNLEIERDRVTKLREELQRVLSNAQEKEQEKRNEAQRVQPRTTEFDCALPAIVAPIARHFSVDPYLLSRFLFLTFRSEDRSRYWEWQRVTREGAATIEGGR